MKVLGSSLMFFFIIGMFACKKEENSLNITYHKSNSTKAKGITVTPAKSDVAIFPNPFLTETELRLVRNLGSNVEIFITSADGRFKKIENITGSMTLDFSDEPKGIYYCEVKIGDIIYQEQFHKMGE